MSKRRYGLWLNLLAALVVALAGWLAVPKVARADWSVVGDKVPKDQVIDNDVLATGTDVVIDGTINGDLLAVGSTVTVNGPVSGSLVAVGRTVTLNGEVGGSTYVLGRTLTLGETASVLNNVHFAGLLLDSRSGSRIGRDLVAASLRARISSQVGRALNALILLLTFDGQIGGDVGQPGAGAQPLGAVLVGPGGTPLGIGFGLGGGSFRIMAGGLGLKGPVQQQGDTSADPSAGIPGWLVARLTDLLILLVVGGLVLWLRPSLVQRPAEWLRRKPLRSAGLGLLVVLLVFPALVVAILLAVLLVIASIWLGSATFWGLAFVLWGIGFSTLILAVTLLILTVLFGSKVVVAELVGSLILSRLAPKVMTYRILPMLLGLVLYVVLRSLPYVGWAVDAIAAILGMGAIWIAYRHRERRPQAVGVDEQVQPAITVES